MDKSETAWEKLGQADAYFSVLTETQYRSENLDETALDSFFRSGRDYIDGILSVVDSFAGSRTPAERPSQALDFGCGVGRLLIPLAERYRLAVGADISETMRREARNNCRKFNIRNVMLVRDIRRLRDTGERFDLVHSFIVFQHIPQAQGLMLFRILLDLIAPAGVGVVHFPFHCTSRRRRIFSFTMKFVPFAYPIWNLLKRRPWSYPYMQMNVYDLNTIFRILMAYGCDLFRCRMIRDGDYEGVILFFRKPPENGVGVPGYDKP